jgi:TRAP-type C4-dicarboxylate transport system substrate-binding protein
LFSRFRTGRPPAPLAILFLAVALVMGMAACEPRPPGVRLVTVAGTTTPRSPGEATWLDFKRNVEEASGGRVQLRPLIYGQLGSEEQLLSNLRRGRIQFANLSAQAVSPLIPELALLYAPFLFDDEAEADYVYDRYLTDIYRELLAEKDLHLITWYEIGFNEVWARDRPVILPGDARGRRFRVTPAVNARLFAESLGADVIPLGFGEVVSSLQTGLIEAGENSISLYARTGVAGEAPHLTLTNHSFGVSVIVSRRRWWQELPPEDRRVLEESFPDITETRRGVRAQNATDLAEARELGIQVHRLTPEQRDRWRQATAGVTAKLIPALGGRSAEIYEGIQRTRAEYRAGLTQVQPPAPSPALPSPGSVPPAGP